MTSNTKPGDRSIEVVIGPPEEGCLLNFRELVRHRRILWTMSYRQIKAEFGDLYLGVFWVLARPLLMTVIFVFYRELATTSGGLTIPYVAYLYSGLMLWFFFSESVSRSAAAIGSDAVLIKKVYFPRLYSPLSGVLTQLSGLSVAFVPLVAIMIYFELLPGWKALLIPVVIIQVILLSLGIGCLFAALNSKSRDWERFLNLMLYVGLFISPVIYSPEMLSEAVRNIQAVNPISGALIAFRAALFLEYELPLYEWLYSVFFAGAIAIIGVFTFQRVERTLMDRI